MTLLEKEKIVPLIIGRGTEEEKKIIKILRSSKIKNIAIIDISCLPLNDHPLLKAKIEKLKDDETRLKIFHGRKWGHIFDNILRAFHLGERKDFVFIEMLDTLDTETAVRSFWDYHRSDSDKGVKNLKMFFKNTL